MRSDIKASSQAAANHSAANAQARAQYEADRSAVESYRQKLQVQVSKLALMSPEQRRQTRLSWVWWDGTDLPLALAEDTLGGAAALLARDDADLRRRDAAIEAAEDAVSGEHARDAGQVADLTALEAQLDPASAQ